MAGPCVRDASGHVYRAVSGSGSISTGAPGKTQWVTMTGLGAPCQSGGTSHPRAPGWACWFGAAGPCVQAGPMSEWWGGPGTAVEGGGSDQGLPAGTEGRLVSHSPLWWGRRVALLTEGMGQAEHSLIMRRKACLSLWRGQHQPVADSAPRGQAGHSAAKEECGQVPIHQRGQPVALP